MALPDGHNLRKENRSVRKSVMWFFFALMLGIGLAFVFLDSEPRVPHQASVRRKYQADSKFAQSVTATTDLLNIRSGPSTECALICTVPGNTKLELTGKSNPDGTWVQVKTPKGQTGWCCQPYLNVGSADTSSYGELDQATLPLLIRVYLDGQKVTILDAKGAAVKTFTCSSGKNGEKTPTGTFTVTGRGISFYNSSIQEGAYYWTRFYNDYLFHSVPFDQNYQMMAKEAKKLGTPASHGCIRLSISDAKWIYDCIPDGTKVIIQ